jgi:hypothetical protein
VEVNEVFESEGNFSEPESVALSSKPENAESEL